MEILYQDKRILVAIKPSGVLSTDEEGGMPQLLREELGDPNACVRTVHRLDAAVSGVMVFARSAKASSLLSQQIRERKFSKEYLAVVHGQPPTEGELVDLLGLNNHKAVILSVVREDNVDAIMNTLEEKFATIKNGKGIAFAVPMSSVIGVQIYQFLSNNRQKKGE